MWIKKIKRKKAYYCHATILGANDYTAVPIEKKNRAE